MTPAMSKRTGKKQQVYICKTTTLQVRHAFLYAFQPSLRDCDVKLPHFMHPLFEVGEHNAKKNLFLYLNLDTILSDLTPENFGSLRKNKGDVKMS